MTTTDRPAPHRRAAAWFGELSVMRAAFVVGLATLVVYLATANCTAVASIDTQATAWPAWELARHGSLAIPQHAHQQWVAASHGTYYSNRFPGTTAWGALFYLLLGGAQFSYAPAGVASATIAAIAVALVFVLADGMLSRRAALGATLVVALGTSMWTVAADALWTHGPAAVCLLAGLLLARGSRWRGAGVAYGLSVLVRPHLALIGATVGVWASVTRRTARPALWCVGGVLAGAAVLVAYQHALWGTWGLIPPSYESRLMTGQAGLLTHVSDVAGTLVSPERGVLVLSPFLLALVPGLRRAWRVAPDWARGSAAGGTIYMLVQLWGNPFNGGLGFYSYRLAIEWLVACTPLLILCWTEWTSLTVKRRRWFVALAGLSVFTQSIGAFGRTTFTFTGPWSTYSPAGYAIFGGAWRLPLALACGVLTGWLLWRSGATRVDTQHSDPAATADV